MAELNDEGCLRLLAAVTLQWWRDADREEHEALAAFMGLPIEQVRGVRPQRIDAWRRKSLIGQRADEGDGEDVF